MSTIFRLQNMTAPRPNLMFAPSFIWKNIFSHSTKPLRWPALGFPGLDLSVDNLTCFKRTLKLCSPKIYRGNVFHVFPPLPFTSVASLILLIWLQCFCPFFRLANVDWQLQPAGHGVHISQPLESSCANSWCLPLGPGHMGPAFQQLIQADGIPMFHVRKCL